MMNRSKYRNCLPQCLNRMFLTDGGLETTLIYHEGIELPCFAAFTLLKTKQGVGRLRAYYSRYAGLAQEAGLGFVLESPTWRANADWGTKLGYSRTALARANRQAVDLMLEVREKFETSHAPMVVSGHIGPRGDGYDAGRIMSVDEAEAITLTRSKRFATLQSISSAPVLSSTSTRRSASRGRRKKPACRS